MKRKKHKRRTAESAKKLKIPVNHSPLTNPKISCLCVTYERGEFFDFLLWNFNKQTYPNRELIVVDGSTVNHSAKFEDGRIHYFHFPGLENIPQKRNIALENAAGDLVTWFDDDDWQHPRKCEILCRLLSGGKAIGGCSRSLFFNVLADAQAKYRGSSRILFNSMGMRTELAKQIRFNEKVAKASDSKWMREAAKAHGNSEIKFNDHPLFFWLSHEKNISNPVTSRRFSREEDHRSLAELLGSDQDEFHRQVKEMRLRLTGTEIPIAIANVRNAKRRLPATRPKRKRQRTQRAVSVRRLTPKPREIPKTRPGPTSSARPIPKKPVKAPTKVITLTDKKRTENLWLTMKPKHETLVGINVWNQFEEARLTYESFIRSQKNGAVQADFLAVDDCSSDPRIEAFFRPLAEQGDIHYIRNCEQKRLTRSWNILLACGVRQGYVFVVQSNADVRFPEGWLSRFTAHLKNGAEFLVPLTNEPGRFSSGTRKHHQDVRKYFPDWKESESTEVLMKQTMEKIADPGDALEIPSANGFFIGFQTDFLKRIELHDSVYWDETPKYLAANRGVGGDESEIRKRTGVQTMLAKDVYIHHTRPRRQFGRSRQEFLRLQNSKNRAA